MRVEADQVLHCQSCSRVTLRRGSRQIYCPTCSAARDADRRASWHKTTGAERQREAKAERRELGAQASADARRGMTWMAEEIEPRNALLRVAVPFSWNFSKNAIYRVGQGGHVHIRKQVKTVRDDLIARVRAGGVEWFEGKTWIDILVQKPNQRGDAINVVDLVCDAVKVGTGVDDRWYSIARLDWEIVKTDPMIYVGISQAVREHHRACSCCGIIKPLTEYGKNAAVNLGHARECRECTRAVDRERRARKREAAA